MFELKIAVDFEAAHFIRSYPGKCSRLHGHNWRVEVAVSSAELNELGMVIDFHDLKAEVKGVVDTLDHRFLNEMPPFTVINPTAENIAKYLYDEIMKQSAFIEKSVKVNAVTVWESPHSSVKYYEVN